MATCVVTDVDVSAVIREGYLVERNKYFDLNLIQINIMGVLHTFWRKYKNRDVAVTQNQIAEILQLNKMTVWKHLIELKENKHIDFYNEGLPRRSYYVNKESKSYVWN